jgi:hypothetical protein
MRKYSDRLNTDDELVRAIERARRPNRSSQRRRRWERDLIDAYVVDGPGSRSPAANGPPRDTA